MVRGDDCHPVLTAASHRCMFECGQDVVLVLRSRRIEFWRSPVLHDDRQGGPTIERLQHRRSVSTEQSEV